MELREGLRNDAYRDTKGVWTIGVGHTGTYNGIPIHAGMRLTNAEVDALFTADLKVFSDAVTALIKVPVTQNQFDALVSFAFNIGLHGFTGSSTLKALNHKDYSTAADDMLMWEKPPELKNRREGERAQFLTPNTGAAPVASFKHVEKTVNPISMITLGISLAKDAAPMIPEIVGDVKVFVTDCEKLIKDLSHFDINTTMADVQKLFEDVQTDIPTVVKAISVAKALPL